MRRGRQDGEWCRIASILLSPPCAVSQMRHMPPNPTPMQAPLTPGTPGHSQSCTPAHTQDHIQVPAGTSPSGVAASPHPHAQGQLRRRAVVKAACPEWGSGKAALWSLPSAGGQVETPTDT